MWASGTRPYATLDRPVRVIFLYYEGSAQETALQLVAAKLKAAHLVEGNLAEGLAAMEMDDGNLMDALMRAVAQGRSRPVEWSGMPVAEVGKEMPRAQVPSRPTPLPAEPPPLPEITEVAVAGGAIQYAFL